MLLASQYLTEDYMTRKILAILGDADLAEEMLEEKDAEDIERLGDINIQGEDENARRSENNADFEQ